ncbi:hypothetical protein CCP3SC1AL1_2210009 [Gammaproteobacteria bacterium]
MAYTIADVKRINRERGHFFFSHDTMRFFSSNVESGLMGERYFITSEQKSFNNISRVYTIREFNALTGGIRTIGDYKKYATKEEALAKVNELLGKTVEENK